jgi:hypothetical protein
MEHVITGIRASKAYFCGSCEHAWNVDEQLLKPRPGVERRRKPRALTLGPKRPRPS